MPLKLTHPFVIASISFAHHPNKVSWHHRQGANQFFSLSEE
jgi:hypothetical protein